MLVHPEFNNGLSHCKDRVRQLALLTKPVHPTVVQYLDPIWSLASLNHFPFIFHSVGNNTLASSY